MTQKKLLESEEEFKKPLIKGLKKFADILIDKKHAGVIYKIKYEDETIEKVFMTYRNSNLILKKLGHTLGISMSVLNRVRDIHNTKIIIVNYEKEDGESEFYYTDINEWYDSDREFWWGNDQQKHIQIVKLKKKQVFKSTITGVV